MNGDSAERAESTETAASTTVSVTRGLPLDGVRVLELDHIIIGPSCSMLLADLGVDVIKVEYPEGGDLIRGSSSVGNSSFNYVDRDKQSLTLDLKSGVALDAFFDLLNETDTVVENYAPGTAERLGIGYEQLKETYPGLVYCSIKGFNPGPYESYPTLDPIAEVLPGLMSVTGHKGIPPVWSGTSIADTVASFYGAIAVLGMFYRRDRTGEGSKVIAPLFEPTVSMIGYWFAYTGAHDDVPGPMDASHPNWAPYDVFETADDEWVFIGPSDERQWTVLCKALSLDLHEDEWFATLPDRREDLDELMDLLRAECETLPAADFVAGLREAGIPVAKVNSTDEVATDPYLRAADFPTEVETAEGMLRLVSVLRLPVVASGFNRLDSTDLPKLGEHAEAILSLLGYDGADIDALRRAGGVWVAAAEPALLDVTCREGEQRPGASYMMGQKVAAVRALDDFGVDYMQVGSPIVGAQTGEVCGAVNVEMKLTGIARAVLKDVEAAVGAGVDVIDAFVPASERQRTELLGKNANELCSLVGETVDSATATGLEVHFTAMNGSRTDPAFLDNLFDPIDATYLIIADTVDSKTPLEVSLSLHDLDIDPTRLDVHFRDDLGVAMANVLTAVAHDVQKVDVSVAGIGERAGNVPVEEFVAAAETNRIVNRPALNPSTLIPRVNDVLTALDKSVPAEKSVLGADAFSHESGLHTVAMLDDPATFEPFDPAVFGGLQTLYFGPQNGTGAARRPLGRAGDDDPDESRVTTLVGTLRPLDEPVPANEVLDIAREL